MISGGRHQAERDALQRRLKRNHARKVKHFKRYRDRQRLLASLEAEDRTTPAIIAPGLSYYERLDAEEGDKVDGTSSQLPDSHTKENDVERTLEDQRDKCEKSDTKTSEKETLRKNGKVGARDTKGKALYLPFKKELQSREEILKRKEREIEQRKRESKARQAKLQQARKKRKKQVCILLL